MILLKPSLTNERFTILEPCGNENSFVFPEGLLPRLTKILATAGPAHNFELVTKFKKYYPEIPTQLTKRKIKEIAVQDARTLVWTIKPEFTEYLNRESYYLHEDQQNFIVFSLMTAEEQNSVFSSLKRKRGDEESPKKPKSAFIFFVQKKFNEVKKSVENKSDPYKVREILRSMWRDLDESSRGEYQQMEADGRARYNRDREIVIENVPISSNASDNRARCDLAGLSINDPVQGQLTTQCLIKKEARDSLLVDNLFRFPSWFHDPVDDDDEVVICSSIEEAVKSAALVNVVDDVDKTFSGAKRFPELRRTEILRRFRYIALTDKEEKSVREIQQKEDGSELVIEKFNTPMRVIDLRTLKTSGWLNDQVINFYMWMLADRESRRTNRTCWFFNSFFVERLLITDGEYKYDNIKRWSKRFDVFAMDKVFFPINIRNTHWTLAVIYVKLKEIRYYDSMNGCGLKLLEALRQWLMHEALYKKNVVLDESSWKLIDSGEHHVPVPEQNNFFDCGVFVCVAADFIQDDLPLTYSQENIPFFRQKIAADIIRGYTLYPALGQ